MLLQSMTPLSAAPIEELRAIRFIAFDFDGVFTDDAVYVSQDGSELVRCWRGDGLGLRKLETLGIGSAILSTETNPVVSVRARKMRIQCMQGLGNKFDSLAALVCEARLDLRQVAFVGNDINDLVCFAAVGLAIGVRNAHEDVLGCIRYRTDRAGGCGAVREVCDTFARAHAVPDAR